MPVSPRLVEPIPGMRKGGTARSPPGSPGPAFSKRWVGVGQRRGIPRSRRREYYIADNPEIHRERRTFRPPGRKCVVPVRPTHWQTAAPPGFIRTAPRLVLNSFRRVMATVPPAERAGIWKEAGTGELALPRGATSFIRPCSPSVPKVPPGTRVPVEEVRWWKKLVITEPIAIHGTGFPKFLRNFKKRTVKSDR